ncbi:MAG: DASS family sodium-coupled anion symporter [Candidatus Marinimicrobia bacterium]|jgi:sodium-dependent dicarboxylate transporter 2/3/5|nr:DASS family sodium-coupled anion symporter [Candidatus Neomarinimicrobiota bacterium]MBT3947652.1 DASS family sodium-coupled anion symporter [Candidatus Neomarinimicrobiota bacterium]MBT4064730.1 DASS family sodium-coupled anion symporter [Candidatus Neomarinimicrobiota bacterium]MBT4452437.1 DASS family sodium-coupled anion symporter [Candidatus Neomarinimicrobiota bacterium]MBT4736488.1 DASS family sodium-coupled anion symporter [Candidatus Neomarinimicrobiota bacterium]
MLGFSEHSLTNFLFWITQKKWFLITMVISVFLLFIPAPSGLSIEGYRSIVIVITALMLIVTEPIPLPAIAMYILVMEVYLGIGSANDIAKSFMNDAVFFIMGSLMLAVAIIKQGWDARIALGIITLTGNKTRNIVFGFTAISAILASFIGEHTVAAIMLPIAMTLIHFTSEDKEKVQNLSAVLLFSIAYGALVGSIGTPSGGGRNVIMIDYLRDSGLSMSYINWMLRVYPLVLIQIPIVSWVLMKSFTPEFIKLDSGVRKLVIQVAKSAEMTGRNTIAAVIFLLVFVGWIFFSESVGLGTIALTGVLMYLVGGFVKWEDLSKNTHWGVILLFGSTISLGSNIKTTGAAVWLAESIVNFIEPVINKLPFVADLIVTVMTTTMANVLSSSATVAVLGPITMNMGQDSMHLGMVTAIASAFGYFTAVAAPACTIVYSSGLVNAKDFLKVGWKMGVISIVLLVIYANTYWLFFR